MVKQAAQEYYTFIHSQKISNKYRDTQKAASRIEGEKHVSSETPIPSLWNLSSWGKNSTADLGLVTKLGERTFHEGDAVHMGRTFLTQILFLQLITWPAGF